MKPPLPKGRWQNRKVLTEGYFEHGNPQLLFTKQQRYDIMFYMLFYHFNRMKGRMTMAVTYNKLRHILVDRNMMKKDLQKLAGLTNHVMMKIRTDQDINTETIEKICRALDCEMTDIMEFYDDKNDENDESENNCPA